MWIIPTQVLSAFSVSARESADWILDSESFTQLAARSLTWRGKDQQQPCWRRLLKRERWTQLLSGLTYEPSIAECFVGMWMEWSAATHAKEKVSPDCNAESMIPDGCGPRSPALCETLTQLGASSRTSPTTSIRDSASSDQTWKRLATELRRRYSLRKKLGRHTGGSGYSSSRWLTPYGMVGVDHTGHVGAGGELDQQVRKWTTPQAHDSQGKADPSRHGRYGTKHGGRNLNDHAAAAIAQWSTPRASPNENRNTKAAPSHGSGHGRTPAGDAQNWSSPRATDGEKGGPNMSFSAGGTPLPAQAVGWATPRAEERNQYNSADNYVALSRQAPRMLTDGDVSLLPADWTSSRLFLNPRFVEWLMGWPVGWTGSGHVEMASYLYRQRTQLVCLLINWMFIGDATC